MKLKFKILDKKNCRMFYAGSMSGVCDFYEERHKEYGEKEESPFYEMFNGIKYECIQATGCHDKNGKEIYHGDIVKCDIPLRNEFYPEYKGIVSIDLATSGKINIRNKNQLVAEKDFIDYLDKLEIIGNVYENKDLL